MQRSLVWTLALSLLVAAWSPAPAAATLIRALDLAALMARAERVALVRAGPRSARRDRFGRIVQEQALEVLEVVTGDVAVGDVVELTTLGGSLDGLTQHLAGEPSLVEGERYVVFLWRWDEGGQTRWRPVGMHQGVMRVESETVLPGDRQGLVDDQGGQGQAAVSAPRPLEALLEELRALVP